MRGPWMVTMHRNRCVTLPVAVLAATLAACGVSTGSGDALPRDAWEPLRLQGSEVEWYDSVEEMADAADLVVVGSLAGFEPGRELTLADPAAGSVIFVNAVFDVAETLSGDASADEELVVEFVTPIASTAEVPAYIDELTTLVGTRDVVLFLRDKATSVGGLEPLPEEEGLLRIVNSYGLVTETAEMPVDVPLGEVPDASEPDGADPPAFGPESDEATQDPRTRWESMDELIAYLRNYLG